MATKANEPTGDTTEAEAPATDAPTSESKPEEADQPQPDEQESPESETGKNEEGETPKSNAAWAAQRVENKKLKEEKERLEKALGSVDEEYLKMLRSANAPQEYQQSQPQQLDENADYSQLTGALSQQQQELQRLRQELVHQRNQLELSQDKQAEEAYPEIKTDKVFEQMVAEKKLAARVLGQDRTTLEIAREVKNQLSKRDEQTATKSAQEKEQQLAEKRAATAESKGQTSGGKSALSMEELKNRVRHGDAEAQTEIARRIMEKSLPKE